MIGNMARLNVNPTRMELKKLKARLSTAVRGHKLLKDKSDEMVRRFTVLLREDKRLRDEVEGDLSAALKQFALAVAICKPCEFSNSWTTALSRHSWSGMRICV